jgi:hypothetical protein
MGCFYEWRIFTPSGRTDGERNRGDLLKWLDTLFFFFTARFQHNDKADLTITLAIEWPIERMP